MLSNAFQNPGGAGMFMGGSRGPAPGWQNASGPMGGLVGQLRSMGMGVPGQGHPFAPGFLSGLNAGNLQQRLRQYGGGGNSRMMMGGGVPQTGMMQRPSNVFQSGWA